jgi:hypothetical protein
VVSTYAAIPSSSVSSHRSYSARRIPHGWLKLARIAQIIRLPKVASLSHHVGMDANLLIALGALAVSVSSLAVSGLISSRQLRSMQGANHVSVAIELLTRDYGRPEFQEMERRVTQDLPGTDKDSSFFELPEPLRSDAYTVATFYDSMAILVYFGFIDEKLVVSTINYRLRQIWSTLEGPIRIERTRRDAPFFDFLEDLCVRVSANDPSTIHRQLKLKEMPIKSSMPSSERDNRSTPHL